MREVCKHDVLLWINAFLLTGDRRKPPDQRDLRFIVTVIVPALIRAAGQPLTGLIDDDLDLDLVTWMLRDLGTYRGQELVVDLQKPAAMQRGLQNRESEMLPRLDCDHEVRGLPQ